MQSLIYKFKEGDRVSDFKLWLQRINASYCSASNAKLKWLNDFGMEPKDFVGTLWSGNPFIPASQTAFHHLSHFVNADGTLMEGLLVSQKNLTVISELGKYYCLVDYCSDVPDFWETVSVCWGFEASDGIKILLSALADLATFHDLKEDVITESLFMDEANRNIFLFSHLTKRLDMTMYCYNIICVKFCLLHYEHQNCDLHDILNGSVGTPIMPGTALLTHYLHHNSTKDESKPFVIIGQYGNHLLPFLSHSPEQDFDISKIVTKKSTYVKGRIGPQDIIELNWIRMSSSFITAPEPDSYIMDTNEHEVRILFKRGMVIPIFKNISFDQLRVADLFRVNRNFITVYGVGWFQTSDFDSLRPAFNITTTSLSKLIRFDTQEIEKVEGSDGIFFVTNSRGLKEFTIQQAKENAIYKFRKLSVHDKIGDYLDFSNNSSRPKRNSINNKQKYFLFTQSQCHLISKWSSQAEFLVSQATSSLQAINFKKTDGIHAPKYTISVGNSIMEVQIGYRGLNKAVYLLTGLKHWFVIPKAEYLRFMIWLESQVSTKEQDECMNWIMHKGLFIDPTAIPECFNVSFICQNAGDLLIFDNYSVFWGWNEDFNISYEWYFAGEGWDKLQHLEPLCDCKRCCPNFISINDLTAMRKKDGIIQESAIPTFHIDEPTYNPFVSKWQNPYKKHAANPKYT